MTASKRQIKSHKGGRDQSGRFRLTSDEKARLDTVLSQEKLSLADYIMKKVEQDMLYEITHEWFGDSGQVTVADAQSMVDEFEGYDGWTLKVETSGDELRIYAYSNSEDANPLSTEWTEVTNDLAYVVIGQAVQITEGE